MVNEAESKMSRRNKQIVRIVDMEFNYEKIKGGEPPEQAIRMAMVELLILIARKVEQADVNKVDWFPMKFPMRLTLQNETCLWDFQLQARLMNDLEIEEDHD